MNAKPSVTSQAPMPGQRPHQRGRARSACGLETARFRALPSRRPRSTEPGSSSSRSATWLDLARLRQEEEDGEAVVVPPGHWDSSPASQSHRAQPILTVGQRRGRIRPLIRAIAKLTALEWASLKGPL